MKVLGRILAAASLVLPIAATAEVTVTEGHVRAPIPGVTSTAAYMTLRNTGGEDMMVERVTTAAAADVTLHTTMNHNGMLHMMGMESLTIPANGSLVLKEGGMHMMLEGPRATLQPGTTVDLVLHFASGTELVISLPVRSVLDR